MRRAQFQVENLLAAIIEAVLAASGTLRRSLPLIRRH